MAEVRMKLSILSVHITPRNNKSHLLGNGVVLIDPKLSNINSYPRLLFITLANISPQLIDR